MKLLVNVCVGILTCLNGIQGSIHLWASEVTRFSSQYNSRSVWSEWVAFYLCQNATFFIYSIAEIGTKTGLALVVAGKRVPTVVIHILFSANQILGKPNVYPRYGSIEGTWAQAYGQLDTFHFIEMKFPRKLFIREINIFETFNAGGVVKISAKDAQNEWIDVFNTTHAHLIQKSRKFSPKIKEVQFLVDELRIEVDCSVSRSYVEIDAVEIIGGRCPRQFKQYRDSCYLIKKDKVSGDKALVRCLQTSGYLANLETLEEAMFLKNSLSEMNTGLSFYVGGRNINRRKAGGDWRWIKNGKMTKMTYFAFGAGEPNGSDSSPQECMFFYAPDRYKLHNVHCDSGQDLGGYICEFDRT